MRRRAAARAAAAAPAANERYDLASQWQLAWRKLLRHRLALAGGGVLLLLYAAALFAGFMAPYGPFTRNNDYINAPPTPLRLVAEDGLHLRPFVYAVRGEVDMESLRRRYSEDTSRRYPLSLLVRGEPYRLWGLIETDRHLFGVEAPGVIYLFGTDDLGRDMFARVLHAGRISLSIGLLGVAFSFVLGLLFGGLSGFYGGAVDLVIQRVVEFLISIPQIPLWMALSAALPANWPPLRVYFGITLILSIVGWTGLARVVRGKLLDGAIIRAPPAAVVHELPDRQPDAGRARHDPGRDRAQLPGPRPAPAGGELGRAAAEGAEPAHRGPALLAADPGRIRGGHGARLQLPRRRPARRRRPLQVTGRVGY